MNSYSYDLHIHSCLSPCGDNDMTPNNIAGMAYVKKLDIFALTDHNTCRNCPATKAVADNYGLVFIPGMELTTSEEIHVVCLFSALDYAMEWDSFVYSHLMKIKNRTEIFGEQLILDSNDDVIGNEENLLINATDISFDDCFSLVKKYGGVAIPAHIDKSSYSVISQLGFIPPDADISCVEVHDANNIEKSVSRKSLPERCHIITNSDAHYLGDINEPINFIHCKEKSPQSVIEYLQNKSAI